jgi:hypothetical protein
VICRKCKQPIYGECVWLKSNGDIAKNPSCQECYEDSVRNDVTKHYRAYETQSVPGRSDMQYHGSLVL